MQDHHKMHIHLNLEKQMIQVVQESLMQAFK